MRQLAGNNDTTFLGKVGSKTASAMEKLLRYFCSLIKLNSTRSCLIKLSQPESVTAEPRALWEEVPSGFKGGRGSMY